MIGPLILQSYKELSNESIKRRLTSAFSNDEAMMEDEEDSNIVTTDDEIEGFLIVKSIARTKISADRVTMRDAKSYCAILVDDNNRKPIIRLRFNTKNYQISLFDGNKNEEIVPISSLDDIFEHSDQILEAVSSHV